MTFSTRFIKANDRLCNLYDHEPAPYFRRPFELGFVPDSAEIVIAGLGFYELTVNGTNVTKGPLAPYINNPDDLIFYDRYDLKAYLRKGKNAIGILLGNGMRNACGGFVWDYDKAQSRGPVCVALRLTASGGGGALTLEADEQFRTHPSPLTFNDLRMGCRYDARMEIDDWDLPDFDDSDWTPAQSCPAPAGIPTLCNAEPIRVTEVRHPVSVQHYAELPFAYRSTVSGAEPFPQSVRKNVWVYDFGVNDAGITVLRVRGKAGQKITIRHGEYLQDGKFSETTTIFLNPEFVDRYLDYGQCDEYICRGGEEVFVPRFKYDGFRYAYVEGLEPEQATADALEFHVLSSGFPERGGFTSSSPVLNRLTEMTVRSDRSNFLYFPTDCPHREKNGWTGDASMSAEHMLLHMRAENSLRVWLRNIYRAQNEGGALPGIVPTGGWGYGWGNGPAWDSVIFNLPYEIYRHTGDKSVIAEAVQPMLWYLAYSVTRRDENGLCAYGLGDWVDPQDWSHCKIAAPLKVTDTVMLSMCARRAAFLFRQIGRGAEADYAERLAKEYRLAVRKNLIDFETVTVAGDCQTSQVFAIATGMFEAAELPAAQARLLDIIHRDGDENACGMIGLRYLFHVLNRMGEEELGYRMLTSEKRTGYGGWVARGMTTLQENFSYPDGRDVNSQNHHFLGDILSVFIQEYAGLKPNPTATDPASFEVSPIFVQNLSSASATYEGIYGKAEVAWERQADRVQLTIHVPNGMHGTIRLPEGYSAYGNGLELTAGSYTIKIKKA